MIFAEKLVLKFADPLKPYILTTDASEYAIGAMLSQLNDEGDAEVVIFISRTLKGSEIYYFTTEKEMPAVVWALNKLDMYLRGAVGITIRTDHEALMFLRSCCYGTVRLRRWALAIQDYDITLEHIPGKRNVVADYLSRHIDDELIALKKEEILVASIINNKGSESLRERFRNLKKFQKQDPKCISILAALEANDIIIQARFRVIDNVLCKKSTNGFYKVIVPEEVARPLILEVHEAYAHIGKKEVQKMLEDFFIFGLRPLLSEMLKTCDFCQRSKYSTTKLQPLMQPIFTDRPGELLSIDFYGPLPTSTAGAKYLLTTIDVFSKFVVIYPIKKANTATVIRKILLDYILKYGKPAKIICDHGTQFISKMWAKKLREEDISLIFSSIRHPQSNIVERMHRELGRFFRTLIADQHTKWATYVPTIQAIINETHHETTEKTPWELHFQTPPERIWRQWMQLPDKDTTPLEERIFLARDTMHRKLKKRARKSNENIKQQRVLGKTHSKVFPRV